MKQKKENRVALLLRWAGGQKIWLFLAILLSAASGLCIIVPYIGIYRLMDATFNGICTKELVVQVVAIIAVAVALRFALALYQPQMFCQFLNGGHIQIRGWFVQQIDFRVHRIN